jgi:hypothetical protein
MVLGDEGAGVHGRGPAGRADVIAALRRHGISGAVAAALWTTARDVRSRTRRRGIEHAVTLDADTGQPVGPVLTGTASSTDLTPHLLALQPNHEYLQLQTHPRSTSFSPDDMLDGMSVDEHIIKVLRAAGRLPEGWDREADAAEPHPRPQRRAG